MTQAAGSRGVAESLYTVCRTTTLSMIADICAVTFLHYLIKLITMCLCLCCFVTSAAIDLLKQLKEKDEMSTSMVVDQVFSY